MLAHPELELVALGSDSLAGQRAERARPAALPERPRAAARVRPERGGARRRRGARLRSPTTNERRAARRTPSSSISPARTASTPALVVRAARSSQPPAGRLIANPGCYATAALLALAPIAGIVDPASVVVDGKSGHLRRRAHAEGQLARGRRARERHARTRSARTSTRPRSRSCSASRSRFVPHVVPLRRGLVCTCYVTASRGSAAAARGRVRGIARRRGDRRRFPTSRGSRAPTPPRSPRSRTRARAAGS